MRVKISYKIRIERELFDRIIAAVSGELRVPADISRAVGIKEVISSSDVDPPVLESVKETVAEAFLIVEERM